MNLVRELYTKPEIQVLNWVKFQKIPRVFWWENSFALWALSLNSKFKFLQPRQFNLINTPNRRGAWSLLDNKIPRCKVLNFEIFEPGKVRESPEKGIIVHQSRRLENFDETPDSNDWVLIRTAQAGQQLEFENLRQLLVEVKKWKFSKFEASKFAVTLQLSKSLNSVRNELCFGLKSVGGL